MTHNVIILKTFYVLYQRIGCKVFLCKPVDKQEAGYITSCLECVKEDFLEMTRVNENQVA